MFQYDCEKPRSYRSDHARRPLPPRPDCHSVPAKPSVPLKVWIIASASCFAVAGALVLATVMVTRWGTAETYPTRELYEIPEPIYAKPYPRSNPKQIPEPESLPSDEINDIQFPILEKLPIFKNIVANRDRKKSDNLASKPQIHPLHDSTLHHPEKKIEKKDQAVYPHGLGKDQGVYPQGLATAGKDQGVYPHGLARVGKDQVYQGPGNERVNPKLLAGIKVPEFKPTLPDVFHEPKPQDYVPGVRKHDTDYYDYYNDENLYDDYMQSNTMTSYLIEKVQELHDWITSDPDFEAVNATLKANNTSNQFGHLLKALNDSLIEGNVTVVMSKLKDIYFGENFTNTNHSRKVILSNSTDLLSFGILTLDVMLLHNIQLMAWENQEAAKIKMLKDPDVFAFNALFLEPSKIEAKRNEVYHYESQLAKRQNLRQEPDEFDFGKNLLENVLEIGMSTARAAIHLGRAYKNTRNLLTQLSHREALNTNIQSQLARDVDANSVALSHLQSSFSHEGGAVYTELDCVWLLYCRTLQATAALQPPYGTMARINGLALRMLTGELPADKALDTMLYEVLAGWTELRCTDMFPRCSKVNAAAVVMDSIMQPLRKSQSPNRS